MNLPNNIPPQSAIIIIFILLWSLLWKILALWRAAKYDQKNWFIVILVLGTFMNLVGLLEIAYLFYFSKKKMKLQELAFWKNKAK